ncbi:MAG: insulinase family protein [Leadbetterella sp.]|nr:insulinase family protein [Leadbetterella sp.]
MAAYLGSLPSSGKKPEFKDPGIYPPKGKVSKTVKKGTEDKANVTLLLSGEYKADDSEELLLSAVGEIIQIKLTEKLREEEGGVYSPYARMSYSRFPSARYQLTVGFGCAPANMEKLITLSQEEIRKIRENGGSPEDIEKYVNNKKLNFQTNLKNNNYWLNALSDKYQKGEDVKSILTGDKALEKVTVESTKAVAQKYLTGDNFIRVVLLPEDK